MLIKQKIIPSKDEKKKKLLEVSTKLSRKLIKVKFIFREKFEDIHLNIEKKLFDIIVLLPDICTLLDLEMTK